MERTKTEVRDWLIVARQRLERVENPALEAQLILGAVLDQPRSKILAHPEWELTAVQLDSLEELLDRRLAGEPLPYILGHWEFFGLQFKVSPAVLIPRPETELLVEHALSWLAKNPTRRNAADVGIGSAAISATLLTRVPDLQVTGIDTSFAALEVAKFNLAAQGVSSRAHLVQADLLSACRGPYDLVCANLPYIPTDTLSGLEVFQKEPALALDGGMDGLRLIERLLADAPRWLASAGLILLEIEAGQGETAPALARSYFPEADIRLSTDLAGLPRLVSIESK
ncbi:MAG: peptide chain release factor N(5)-glutamine methyltransferase [Bellilinea sp.]